MNQHRLMNIIYPLFLYFAVEQVVNLLLQLLTSGQYPDAVGRQGLGTLAAFVALYLFLSATSGREERQPVFFRPISGRVLIGSAAALLMLGAASVAMNNLLSFLDLASYSRSYQNVEEAFYSSSLSLELLVLGIVTPVAEEFLYRWVLYREFRSWLGRFPAILVSSLLFGVIHLNLVQFVYAAVLGLLLCLLVEYYQDVRPAMLGHMAANSLALLRGETGFLSWLTPESAAFLPVTLVLFAAALLCAGIYIRKLLK